MRVTAGNLRVAQLRNNEAQDSSGGWSVWVTAAGKIQGQYADALANRGHLQALLGDSHHLLRLAGHAPEQQLKDLLPQFLLVVRLPATMAGPKCSSTVSDWGLSSGSNQSVLQNANVFYPTAVCADSRFLQRDVQQRWTSHPVASSGKQGPFQATSQGHCIIAAGHGSRRGVLSC